MGGKTSRRFSEEYVPVQKKACTKKNFLYATLLSGGRGLFLTLSAPRKARGPWVHDGAYLGLARAQWRCSGHLTSPTWLYLTRVVSRLAEPSR